MITVPRDGDRFAFLSSTELPSILFRTDATGPHVWTWQLRWRSFRRQGEVETTSNQWNASTVLHDLGGLLKIRARRRTPGTNIPADASASGPARRPPPPVDRAVNIGIFGTNPNGGEVAAYLASKPGSNGFGAVLAHETRNRHFTALGEPIVSFDNGFGICQLTSPAPTFEQCWSWKRNIDAGLLLFEAKRRAAAAYLSQAGRHYSDDQLTRETVARWNGGGYHKWSGTAWVRNPDMLCDPTTGNIGWDTTNPVNDDMTLEQLRARDSGQFRRPRSSGAGWRYSGVCYADALLG